MLIIKSKVFSDNRGFFKEVEKKQSFKTKFVFDCFSYSKKNTLRGLHLQTKNSQAKIITVVQGEILDVVVDLRKNSKTYGKYFSIKISQNSDFFFSFLKILHMGFYVCLNIVQFIINVLIIDINQVKQLLNGMIKKLKIK